MDELKRLVKLVAGQSDKPLPLITQQDDGSLEKKLFNAIKAGIVSSDEEAATLMYGNAGKGSSYRMLKSRLRKKLLNNFVFLEYEQPNEMKHCAQEIDECSILLHQVRKLLSFGEYKSAQKVTEQLLYVSVAAELTDFTIKALEYQRRVCLLVHDKQQYTHIVNELQKYYQLEAAERKAENLFYTAKMELAGRASDRNRYLPQLPAVLQELRALWEQTSASRVFNLYLSLTIAWLELTGNYQGIFEAVQEAEALLDQGKINPKWYNDRFNKYIKIYACIRTQQYELGLAFAQRHWRDYNPNSFNWFAFMENYIQLALYTRKYELAMELMRQVIDNSYFSNLSRNKRERWELHRKYLLLLCRETAKETKYSFLTQEICAPKILSADKEGANLPVIILRLLDDLLQARYDNLAGQPELISKYIARYLRGDKAERVRIFLRLLMLVIKEEGNLAQVQVKSKPLLERLKAAMKPEDTFAELEIVPYEHLWELVQTGLRRR